MNKKIISIFIVVILTFSFADSSGQEIIYHPHNLISDQLPQKFEINLDESINVMENDNRPTSFFNKYYVELSDSIFIKSDENQNFVVAITARSQINNLAIMDQVLNRQTKIEIPNNLYQKIYNTISNYDDQFLSQFSSNNIPVEQQFFVGGLTTGRGYKNGFLSSNRGLDFAAEIRYTHKFNNLIEEVMPYGFYDITKFSKNSAGSNKSSLQSAGFGVKIRTKYDVNILLESGFPFTKKITVDGVENYNSNKFSFTVGKEFKF